jgi:hypothetical protein
MTVPLSYTVFQALDEVPPFVGQLRLKLAPPLVSLSGSSEPDLLRAACLEQGAALTQLWTD